MPDEELPRGFGRMNVHDRDRALRNFVSHSKPDRDRSAYGTFTRDVPEAPKFPTELTKGVMWTFFPAFVVCAMADFRLGGLYAGVTLAYLLEGAYRGTL